MKLDAIDVKILAALQKDGRITLTRLGDTVGLSPSPCHERVRRLEAAGLITGYFAAINVEKLARHSLIFVEVCLTSHAAGDFERFRKHIAEVPEVLECYQTSGVFDFLLKVIASDIDRYQALMDRLVQAEIGIGRFTTCVVTKPVKRYGPYPLDCLLSKSGEI